MPPGTLWHVHLPHSEPTAHTLCTGSAQAGEGRAASCRARTAGCAPAPPALHAHAPAPQQSAPQLTPPPQCAPQCALGAPGPVRYIRKADVKGMLAVRQAFHYMRCAAAVRGMCSSHTLCRPHAYLSRLFRWSQQKKEFHKLRTCIACSMHSCASAAAKRGSRRAIRGRDAARDPRCCPSPRPPLPSPAQRPPPQWVRGPPRLCAACQAWPWRPLHRRRRPRRHRRRPPAACLPCGAPWRPELPRQAQHAQDRQHCSQRYLMTYTE